MRTTRDVLVVVGAFALAGVLAALVWHWWWSPAPVGVVFENEAFFDPDQEFRATGTFIAVSVPVALLLSMVLTRLFERDELVTLAAVVVGAVLATTLMLVVGHELGPESADEVARRARDRDPVRADLTVQPFGAWLAWPASAAAGSIAILLTFSRRRSRARPPGYAPRRT